MSNGRHRARQSRLMPRWLQLPRQKMSRDCFITPRAARWSTSLSLLIIMITRWAMDRVQRGAGKGMKKTRIHPLRPESAGPIYLGPLSALVLLCSPDEVCNARIDDRRGDEIQFFPFYRPSSGLPLSRKRSSPCDAPHAVVVGRSRICKFRRRIVSASCPLLTPSHHVVHKRSRSNFHPVRNFYFSIERNDKAGYLVPKKGDGT